MSADKREIAQMNELIDACRGQITGSIPVVLLEDGTAVRITHVSFTGGAQQRTLVLHADSSAYVGAFQQNEQ